MTKSEFTAHKLSKIDRAVTDRRLTHFNFRLLWFLAAAADSQTGIARGNQAAIARAIGVDRRTVQVGLYRLVGLKYLKQLSEKRHGNVNTYSIVRSKDAVQGPHVGNAAKDAVPTPHRCGVSHAKMLSGIRNTTLSSNPFILPSEPDQLTDSGPRSRVNALGPLGEALCQRIGRENFKAWFGKGKAGIISQTDDTITIAARSEFSADTIRNRFEPDILAITGLSRIEIVVRKAATEPAQ